MPAERLAIQRLRLDVSGSDIVDGEHYVDGAATDNNGRLLRVWGRYSNPIIPACCVVPFYTIALLESGAAEKYALDDEEVALAASSQGGEHSHRELCRKWFAKLGLPQSAITLGPQQPYSEEARNELIASRSEPSIFHNGNVGRHLSFLTICLTKGFPTKNYMDVDHPIQRYVWRFVAPFLGSDTESFRPDVILRDGMPMPTVSLDRLASAFAKFCTDTTGPSSAAALRIRNAMMRYPHIITFPSHFPIPIMKVTDGKIIIKTAAASTCVACHLPSRVGIAFKIRDGSESLRMSYALLPILRRLDLLSDSEWQQLARLAEPDLVSSTSGKKVGSIKSRFAPAPTPLVTSAKPHAAAN